MKKIFTLIFILTLALSMQAVTKGDRTSGGAKSVVSSSRTLTPAAQHKADAIYESLSRSYAQGKVSADGVVDKALYHKVWSPELAERCLRLVSDNNPRAMAELGLLYTYYKTAYMFPDKEADGVRLMETAARAGNKDASDYLGVYYNRKGDYKKAAQYFEVAAPNNNPLALHAIGGMYDSGHGYKKNFVKARDYYRKAAMKGHGASAAKYGLELQRQRYGGIDMPGAFMWLYIGGDLGDDTARSNLELPLRGERFGDDAHTEFMRHALALGDAWNANYGKKFGATPLYIDGFKAGLDGYSKAAKNGDEWSLFYLGSMSFNDEFLNQNDELILECYEPLIASGKLPKNVLALVYERMAEMYRNGRGVKVDKAKAADYTRKAADYGSLTAYKIIENIPD